MVRAPSQSHVSQALVLKNIGANWIQLVASIAIAYYLTPFTLHTLGRDQYGMWLLITAITGYLGLLVLGLPMASVRFVARHARDADPTQLNRAVANCLGICSILGGLVLAVGGVAFLFFRTYPIAPAAWPSARMAFIIIVANVAFGFVGQLPLGILAAHEQFVLQNKILLASLLTRFAFTVTLLRLRPSFVVLALSLVLSSAIEASAGAIAVHRRYPHIRPRLSEVNWETSRAIFGFSLFVLLMGVGAQLSFQSDAIVIGKMLGVRQIPFFSTASMIAVYLMQLVIGIAAVVMPTSARLHAQGGVEPLRDVLLKWSKICLSLTLFVSIYLLVAGPSFLGWWLGHDFVVPSGRVLRVLTIANIVFLPARGVALPMLMGIGSARRPAIGFVMAGLLNLVLSLLLSRPYGITGVALGTAIANVLFAGLLVQSACQTLGVRPVHYLGYVVQRPLLGAIPVLASLYLLAPYLDLARFAGLFVAGVLMAVSFAAVWVFYVYRDDRFVDLLGMMKSRFARAA